MPCVGECIVSCWLKEQGCVLPFVRVWLRFSGLCYEPHGRVVTAGHLLVLDRVLEDLGAIDDY